MRTRTIATMNVLVLAWAVSFCAAQTVEDDARARAARRRAAAEAEAKRKAEGVADARAALAAKLAGGPKTELDRFAAYQVPRAWAVGVGTVLAAKVRAVPLEAGGPGPEFHALEVKPATMLYGPRPKGEKISLPVLPPRDPLVPRLNTGDKIIFALGKTPRHSLGAVHWSKRAEEAVLGALAPGWEREKCFRCPWCRQKDWKAGKGKCGLCGGATASGSFKVCAKCAAPAGRCQMCKRTVGPASSRARIYLSCVMPHEKVNPSTAATRMAISPGTRVKLWVSARVPANASVAELLCPGGKELSGCKSLCFLVDSPGRREQAVLFPILQLRSAEAKAKPKPLMNSSGTNQVFWAEMSLNDGKGVFKREGSHTVRAVAGRLVSRPVTVVVEERKPVAPPPVPPAPRPAGLEDVVPQITPDGRGVQATRNGKMLWRTRLRDAVGAVEQKDGLVIVTSQDGKTVIKLDLATGKMISKRVDR